jgi:WD40 repeat protein
VFEHGGNVTFADFSAGGHRIGTISDGGTVRVWDREVVKRLSAVQRGHSDHVWDVAFRPQQKSRPQQVMVVTTSFDNTARIWNYDFNPQLDSRVWRLTGGIVLQGHQSRVRSAGFSHNGELIATVAYDGSARLWGIDGRPLCVLPVADGQRSLEVTEAFFGPKDDWLVTEANDNAVRVWTLSNCFGNTGEGCRCSPAETIEHDSPVRSVTVRVAGDRALIASADQAGIRISDPQRGWQTTCRVAVTGAITDMDFSPDLRLLAAADENGRAAVWGTASCRPVAVLNDGHNQFIYSIRFDPAGKRLVTASQDGTAVIWGSDGSLFARLAGHADRVYFAEFNNDGQWVVTASRDGTAGVWKTPAKRAIVKKPWMLLEGNRGGVSRVTFSSDSRFVATAYWNNAAELWYVLEDGQEPIVPAFASQISKENDLDGWARQQQTPAELSWWQEAWRVLQRFW